MKKFYFYSLILFIALSGITRVQAANTYTLLEPLPCVPGTGNVCTDGNTIKEININTYLSYVFKFSIALAVFLATVQITIGGFQWMMSEGFTKISEAKSRITNAVIGLLSALASYLILQTIDPRLVQVNTTIPPICDPDPRKVVRGSLCDRSVDFQKILSTDLQNISIESKNRVIEIQKSIDATNERIKTLNEKDTGPEGLTPEELAELEALNQNVVIKTNQQLKEIINDTLIKNFQISLDTISDPTARSSSTGTLNSNAQELVDTTLKNITDPNGPYQKYMKQLKDSGDYQAYHEAEVMGQFYQDQIHEQVKINDRLAKYEKTRLSVFNPVNLALASAYKKELETSLNTYNNPANDDFAKKYRSVPEILAKYNQIKDNRIKTISQELGLPIKN